jgi:hypothetical protein
MAVDPMREARPVVDARSRGICERCGIQRAGHKHHRKLRRHGDHRPANLLDLCSDCHRWVHEHVAQSYEFGYLVRSTNNPRIVPVKHARFGWVRLLDNGDTEPTSWTEREKQR